MTVSNPTESSDVREILASVRRSRMNKFQVTTVALALALIVMDGFEVAMMAFAAPQIQAEMNVSPDLLGYILSSTLLGMALGSMFLAPIADRVGRRPVTLAALLLILVGMILAMTAQTAGALIVWRVLTGLGVGCMMANLNALVAEYSSDARRSTAIGIFAAGYPIGATVAGLVASQLIPAVGWRSMFVVGALLAAAGLLVSFFRLPESIDYLLERQPEGGLDRVNALLVKLDAPQVNSLPPREIRDPATNEDAKSGLREVLTPPTLKVTIGLWVGYGMLMISYYFATTWLPTMITNVSGDEQVGTLMGTVTNVGGVLGCFLFALLAVRFSGRKILYLALFVTAVGFALFGLAFEALAIAFFVGFLMGVSITVAVAGFYAVGPIMYSARARSTGVGWMLGLGRLLSVVAPVLVGYLLTAGLAPETVFIGFSVPLLIAALACLTLVAGRKATAVMAD